MTRNYSIPIRRRRFFKTGIGITIASLAIPMHKLFAFKSPHSGSQNNMMDNTSTDEVKKGSKAWIFILLGGAGLAILLFLFVRRKDSGKDDESDWSVLV